MELHHRCFIVGDLQSLALAARHTDPRYSTWDSNPQNSDPKSDASANCANGVRKIKQSISCSARYYYADSLQSGLICIIYLNSICALSIPRSKWPGTLWLDYLILSLVRDSNPAQDLERVLTLPASLTSGIE